MGFFVLYVQNGSVHSLRSLSFFVVFSAVSNGSRNCNAETEVYLDLLSTIPSAVIRSMNNYLLNKLMHDLRSKLIDMVVLMNYIDKRVHIS